MMHMLKIEPRLFSLKGFFWLCLFELLHSNSDSLSQELTVVVQAGDEARLPCRYQITSGTLKSYYIYWQKYNFDKQDLVVISYKNGEEVELEKDKSYKNRSKLEEQNLTLSIASVTVNDSGLYKCFVISETHLKGENIYPFICDSQELTVVVQAGDEARLPCRYQITSGTLKSYYIYWQKYNFDKQDLVVISYKNGEEVELEKDKSYKNRSKLEEQNLTLSIASVTVNDSGLYKCFAISETHLKGETSTRLSVIDSLSQELTVVVQAGDEARLPCRYQITSGTLKSYYIYWQKYNFDKQDLVVISYKNGEEVELEKDKSYKNRSKLEEQNLTLSIASVTVNDSGLYKCFAISETHLKGKTSTRLSVIVPFSTPIILNNLSGEHCDSKNLTLMCLSHGGSSEPKMYGSINENPVNWIVTSNKIFGHFNITGTLQLKMTENILIQCSVHYLDFQVSSNYSLNMTKNCSEPTMPPLIPPFGTIISSGVILIFFLAMVMLVILQCYFHKRPKSSTTHQSLATDEMILSEQSRSYTRSRLERSPL